MALVHIANIVATKGLNQPTHPVRLLRRQQQVNMVGHQNVGVDRYAIFPAVFLELVQIDRVVLFGEETGLAVVAALDDVLRNAGQAQAGESGHCGSPSVDLFLILTQEEGEINYSDPFDHSRREEINYSDPFDSWWYCL